MMSYKIDHKNFSFITKLSPGIQLNRQEIRRIVIEKVSVNKLYAKIVKKSSGAKVIHKLVKIENAPHFKFVNEDKTSYGAYLRKHGKNVGYGIEHSTKKFEKLLKSKENYLEGKYHRNYILCDRVRGFFGSKTVIIDGVHRACILLKSKVKEIPAAVINRDSLDKISKYQQLNKYIDDYKDDFLEWYTPLEIEGRIIHERTYPDFKERPEFLNNKERGESKWDYIIKKNLPNLRGKTVCDVGCNIGLYSIFMSKLGAKKVDGFDRGERVIQPTNRNLPRQNIIQQAYFVKNIFILSEKKRIDNVEYFECDIARMDFSKFKYDFFFSSCVLYHFGKKKFEEVIKQISKNIPEVFLQTNLGHHGGKLSKTASMEFQERILRKYNYHVKITAPKGYPYPVIYGYKKVRK